MVQKLQRLLPLMIFYFSFLVPICSHPVLDYIDPINDFRYPPSFVEVVQEGASKVIYMMEYRKQTTQTIDEVIASLISFYVELGDNSFQPVRAVSQEDKDYLQQLLYRIDGLINTLEGTDDKKKCAKVLLDYVEKKVRSH
jgi:hypothetical protein